jgi:pyruvate,water dikinase
VIRLLQVAFTIDPDTGFQNTIIIKRRGLSENIVKGAITPEWMVFKPTLENIKLNPILKDIGRKEFTMIYAEKSEDTSSERTIINTPTTVEKKNQFSLNDKEVIQLHNGAIKLKTL